MDTAFGISCDLMNDLEFCYIQFLKLLYYCTSIEKYKIKVIACELVSEKLLVLFQQFNFD